MKKNYFTYFCLLMICSIAIISACNIPRDNVLDPKNPDSKQSQKVLIQAFVNTEHETEYNNHMIQALYQLKNEYNGQVIIAEHHRNTPGTESPYHMVDNELLYQTYLDGFEDPIKGVPDVFFNGIQARVQGASSVSTAVLRLQDALSAEVNRESRFLIDLDYESTASGIQPIVSLARLGKQDFNSILVKCLLVSYKDRDHQFVVVDQNQSRLIGRLKHGDTEILELPALVSPSGKASTLIVYVTDQNEQIVYQSELMAL